jgi:hypothetical protein
MPQRTISAAGGNWNSLATWVEGAIPTTSDFVVGNASSGNLTVNVSTAATQYLDLSGYTGTLTINSTFLFNTAALASSTSVFNAGSYNFLGTALTRGGIALGSASKNIRQVGTLPIPYLLSQGTNTLLTDIYVEQLRQTARNINNNYYVSGNFYTTESSTNTSTSIVLSGSGVIESVGGVNNCTTAHRIVMNTSGTYTIKNNGLILIGGIGLSDNAGQFIYSAGTIVNSRLILINPSAADSKITLSTNSYNFDSITFGYKRLNNSGIPPQYFLLRVDLLSPLTTTNLYVSYTDIISSTNSGGEGDVFRVSGNKLQVTNFVSETSTYQRVNIDGNLVSYDRGFLLQLDPAYTHEIGSINMGGNKTVVTQTPRLESSTSGSTATIQLSANTTSYAAWAGFTDIAITSSTPLYTYFSTLTRTSGISNSTTFVPSSGGTSQTAYTFAS